MLCNVTVEYIIAYVNYVFAGSWHSRGYTSTLGVGIVIFSMQVYLQTIYVRVAYEGHRVKVKVKFQGQGQFQGLVYNF